IATIFNLTATAIFTLIAGIERVVRLFEEDPKLKMFGRNGEEEAQRQML
ncbi:hypothetical protein Goklo_023254, partial [Gossypium klotzschianum]|nr:hypothetical protein [Gossypium klotzschianum]